MKALGAAGLATLLGRTAPNLLASAAPERAGVGRAIGPHFAPKAKRAIYLFMAGSPSQFETWDYKPALAEMFDKDLPESVRGGQVLTGMTRARRVSRSRRASTNSRSTAKRGTGCRELFPHTAKVADELCVIKSLTPRRSTTSRRSCRCTTGNMFAGRPSHRRVAFVRAGRGQRRVADVRGDDVEDADARERAGALEPAVVVAAFCRREHAARVACARAAIRCSTSTIRKGVDGDVRRAMIDGVNDLNRQLFERVGDPEINARISQYEMAFRMQTSRAGAGGFLRRAGVDVGALRRRRRRSRARSPTTA